MFIAHSNFGRSSFNTTFPHYKKMATMNKVHHHHSIDFSGGVLDLSNTRKIFEGGHKIYEERTSPDTQYHSSPTADRAISTTHYPGAQFDDSFNSRNFENAFRSPQNTYPAQAVSGEGSISPNYAACYPGTEHLSPYVLQAAFRQQSILQNKTESPKQDSETPSETGSDESFVGSPGAPMYPIQSTPGRDGKVPRPFKAYPKDPMTLAAGLTSLDTMLDTQSAEKYSAFRKRMLEQICEANGGQATVSNPKMRRVINHNNTNNININNNNNECFSNEVSKFEQQMSKDDSYTERRRKNNAAAKKSRDRRRIKEDEIAIRAAFLERENIELKFELAAVRKQLQICGIGVVNNSS